MNNKHITPAIKALTHAALVSLSAIALIACQAEVESDATVSKPITQEKTPEVVTPPLVRPMPVSVDLTTGWLGEAVELVSSNRLVLRDISSDDLTYGRFNLDVAPGTQSLELDIAVDAATTDGAVTLFRLRHFGEGIDVKQNLTLDLQSGDMQYSGGARGESGRDGSNYALRLIGDVPVGTTLSRLYVLPAARMPGTSGTQAGATGEVVITDLAVTQCKGDCEP